MLCLVFPALVLGAKVSVVGYSDNWKAWYFGKGVEIGLKMLPEWHYSSLADLKLNGGDGNRGLANGGRLILNTGGIDDLAELIGVLVHEVGHVLDLGVMTKWRYGYDPSEIFYSISWTRDKAVCTDCFVSGYAATDKYEDFAETYTLYRLNSPRLRYLAEGNRELTMKYIYMNIVFGKEYCVGRFQEYEPVYDVTKLSIGCLEI